MNVSGMNAVARRKRAAEPWGDRGAACRFVTGVVGTALATEPRLLTAAGRGSAQVAFARGAAMYLAHVKLGMTMTEVGRQFGRDRTTVSHACARVEDAREDRGFDALLVRLEAALDGWRRVYVENGT